MAPGLRVPLPVVEAFLASWEERDDRTARIDFTVLGEPRVQNGWKVRWRGLRVPVIYDPCSRRKTDLRAAIRTAMLEGGLPDDTAFPAGQPLVLSVEYFYKTAYKRDLDNMTKFLLDALEGAIFPDDNSIMKMELVKKRSAQPRTVVSVSTL